MKWTVLSDNRSCNPALETEHGLSILLTTERHNILLDTGASDLFIRNAELLGVNLSDVDYVFISHGHSDHAGGLRYFLEHNQKAQIIVSPDAMSGKFFSKRGNLHSITSEWPEIDDDRLILINQTCEKAEGIHVIAHMAIPEVGEIYDGVVQSIMPYGCFVEIMPGKDGLLHISEIDWKRLETVEEAGIKEGDHIQVKLLEIDPKTGKYKLSHRVLIPKPEGYVERPARRERGDRPERGERGERRDRPERGERRPRPEHTNSELGDKLAASLRSEEYHDPAENHEPKDFSDTLDHMDF